MEISDSQEMCWEAETNEDDDEYNENDDYEQSSGEDEEGSESEATAHSKDMVESKDYGPLNEALLTEIEMILKGSSVVNCTNALALNKVMKEKLMMVRDKLLQLLECVKKRYASNEVELKQTMKSKPRGIGIRGAYLRGSTFYFKGNMFFKDINCRNCPNNPDYIYRSEVENEMFPMDFELCGRHVWSIKDKVNIVKGIKEQVLDYLDQRKNNRKKPKSCIQKKVDLHTVNLAKLWESVDSDFEIDWHVVSSHDVKHRHSVNSCNAMWNVYLKPSLKRTAWTSAENDRLLQAARRYNYEDWKSIAEEVGNRSNYQCFINFYNNRLFSLENKKSLKWTKQEDKKLLSLARSYTMNGVINWNAVCSRMPNRSKIHITTRYLYTLDPKISHQPFTPEEDLTLLAAIEEYGENFGCIPRSLFPNRSSAQLRGRYRNTLKNRKKIKGWSAEENQKLMDLVAQYGESSWTKCAEMLGHHSRISCRTRYITIKKFLEKNPNASIKDIPSKRRRANTDITTENWVEKIAELGRDPKCLNSKSKNKKVPDISPEKNIDNFWQPKISIKELNDNKTATVKPQRRSRRGAKLVDRLRSIELEMYHFFKYSYSFELGTDPCTKALTKSKSLLLTENACGFQVPMHKPFIRDLTLPHSIAMSCQKLLIQPRLDIAKINLRGYRLPPSWSTLMGFRALCVQSAQTITIFRSTNTIDLEKVEAVHTLRQRLRVLFYKTGLLSRLSPRSIPNVDTRLKCQLIDISKLFQTASVEPVLQQPQTQPKKAVKRRKMTTPNRIDPSPKIVKLSEAPKTSQNILNFKTEPSFEYPQE